MLMMLPMHLKSIEYINNKNQNNDFNMGCGKGYSIFEIIKLTKSKIGNKIDIIKKPKDLVMLLIWFPQLEKQKKY